VFQKRNPLAYFDDNFGKYGPILTIFSLLQQDIYDTQKLSYFSHLTFFMLPLYLAKQTLMLVFTEVIVKINQGYVFWTTLYVRAWLVVVV